MLVIRLCRTGKKNSPSYRLVAADSRRAVKGKFIEVIGFYNPIIKPKIFSANKEKVLEYIKNGAKPSATVLNLLCDHGVLPKNQKVKIVHAKKKEEKPEDTNDPKKDQKEVETKVAEETVKSEEIEPTNSETEENVAEDANTKEEIVEDNIK